MMKASMKQYGVFASMAGLFTMVLMAFPLSSEACCGDGAVAAMGAIAAGGLVTAAIAAATMAILLMLAMLGIGMGVTGGKVDEVIQKQMASQKVVAEGLIAVETQNRMSEIAGDIITTFQSETFRGGQRTCFDRAAGVSIAAAYDRAAPNAQVISAEVERDALGVGDLASALRERFDDQTTKYVGGGAGKWRNAHINTAVTFMSGSGDALDDEGMEAAKAAIDNIVGTPRLALPEVVEGRDLTSLNEQSKMVQAMHNTEAARASVTRAALDQQARMRLVDGTLTPTNLGMNLDGMPGVGANTALSPLQAMKFYVESRFVNPEWHTRVRAFRTEGLLEEITKIMAYKVWQDFKIYESVERMSTILATENATLTEIATRLDQDYDQARQRASRHIN